MQQKWRKLATRLEILFLLYDVEWSPDHFFVDIGDIDTDKPEWHEDDSYHDSIYDDHDTDIREAEVCDTELIDKLEK